jgi:uncharacterized membrane protein
MGSSAERADRKETARLESFSDGVFAFAITLLVLYLKDPTTNGGGSLLQGLLNQWPEFFAFVTSFATILIMWVGHHEMFNAIGRMDRGFMFLNGILLFFVTLTPFTTSLVANHIASSDSRTAAAVYAGSFLLLSLSWGILGRHVFRKKLLRDFATAEDFIRTQTRGAFIGLAFYALAFALAFLSGIASVVLILMVAVYYAVGPTSER